jgi:hypothetical protein
VNGCIQGNPEGMRHVYRLKNIAYLNWYYLKNIAYQNWLFFGQREIVFPCGKWNAVKLARAAIPRLWQDPSRFPNPSPSPSVRHRQAEEVRKHSSYGRL